ncbi:DUF4362 domain-containing protein [Cohnella nanjingensis]|uniref:DUF4362 domain-containing protein n=1 Tax=Cohnella nanjingensis TaxID=1387779 RepID=A0A7X0RTU7_9BACL|nr:DUF4362 domain-containing protein [Cohnella nanjingensis]MBB6673438.1 DUF4362 domain-containing protein [Cohnella nanjingensis]
MNKLIFLLVSVSLLGSSLGCSNNDDKSTVKSKPYSSNEAITKGDVVYLNKVYNIEKFNRFITNLDNKKADSIRITGYTDEGDPIFKDLKYDGKEISYTYDNSNDEFGGSNKGVRSDICSKVSSEKNAQGEIDYSISGCTKNDSEMSYFLIRIKKE